MSFWDNVQTASGIGEAYLWVVLGFIAAAFVLFGLVPAERTRIRAAVLLFALSFAGLLVAGALLSYGASADGTAYRWTWWAALFIQNIAIINLASVFVFDVVLHALRLKPARIMRDLLVALAYVVIAITLLSRSGVDLTGIVATSAVITAVIGFALQDTLGNVMGGMALQMERSIGVGDWIRVDRYEGQVKEISWRQTSIETRDWDTIVIPNSVLMKGQVTVLGRRAGAPRHHHRQTVLFNIDFRYSPADVIGAVEEALRREPIENVAHDPVPHCILIDFKESYASYSVRYWLIDIAPNDPTDSVVRTRIYFALHRAGIPLSIPAQALFVTEESETRRERKRVEEIERRVEALQRVDLFSTLTEDERRKLAARLRVAPYVRGEAIMRQGGKAQSLYIMTKGDAEVRIAVDGNLSEKVATLHGGDFFGEMGLMTGEPRTATVVAETDVECYRLEKDAFNDILRRRPEIAEDISRILARRRVELEAVRGELNEEAMRQRVLHTQHDLLKRIRKFFTLESNKA